MSDQRKKIAVLFGGRSPEHDISIITGLQALNALDTQLYDPFPIYISYQGKWWIGDTLRKRSTYIPSTLEMSKLSPVSLELKPSSRPTLISQKMGFFQRQKRIEFDFAIPALHGLNGEDGHIAALLNLAGVPYAGTRALPSALFMDKIATKRLLASAGIPQLPYWKIERPSHGLYISARDLEKSFPGISFPCCVKPVHLGSSIGVARVEDWQQLAVVLPRIFRFDTSALLEPFISPLEEFNVSVCRKNGTVHTSAIERPKSSSELLDFKAKYLSQNSQAKIGKISPQNSEGMLSLTRDINPSISPKLEASIREWAAKAFEWGEGSGIPRVDFLYDKQRDQLWLNEINPCPGSFAYFLWEKAKAPILFAELLEQLIEEGFSLHEAGRLAQDPTPEEARLFPRKV